jgi:hypothetical protein
MKVINNVVKVILTTSVWSFVCGLQVVENNNFVPNLPLQNLLKVAKNYLLK